MSYILLNTRRFRDNKILETNNYDIQVESKNILNEKISPLSTDNIERLLNDGSKEDSINNYYNATCEIHITEYLKNKFKTTLSEIRDGKKEEIVQRYREFEKNIGDSLFLCNKIYKDTELFKLALKYAKKILDLLGDKKINFIYEDSIYYTDENEDKFYFDIDIVDIDVTFFSYLKDNKDFEILLNEIISNLGLIDSINFNIDDETENNTINVLNGLILTFVLCYIITESIYSFKNRDTKRFNKAYKNINLCVVDKKGTLYTNDLQHKLNQMYLILKNKIIKQHLLRHNSYSQEKRVTIGKDTKIVVETNDIILFLFNYLTNKVINCVYDEDENVNMIQLLESHRENKINKIRLSNKKIEKQEQDIKKIEKMTYSELKKDYNRQTKKY